MSKSILIVENNCQQRDYLKNLVSGFGYHVIEAENGDDALDIMLSNGTSISAVILELILADRDGLSVLSEMRKKGLQIPVIAQLKPGNLDSITHLTDRGVFDFIVKPISLERLKISLQNAIAHHDLIKQLAFEKEFNAGHLTLSHIIANSTAMAKATDLVRHAAQNKFPVHIFGEKGVGKELIARAIHGESKRCHRPFVTVDCRNLNEADANRLIFGIDNNSVDPDAKAKLHEASGGTLYLKNISELPKNTQLLLSHFLETGSIEASNIYASAKFNVRIISSSGEDILEAVKQDKFRQDLYYRISVYPIKMPALRHRIEDLSALSHNFATKAALEFGCSAREISGEAVKFIIRQKWDMNAKSLYNVIRRAVLFCEDRVLDECHLKAAYSPLNHMNKGNILKSSSSDAMLMPNEVSHHDITLTSSEGVENKSLISPFIGKPIHSDSKSGNLASSISAGASLDTVGKVSILSHTGKMRTFSEIENDILIAALDHYDGNLSRVAKHLKLGRSTLYRKLDKLEECA